MKLIRSQPPASIADGYRNMNPEELLSLYGSRKFDKTLIDKHCPEVLQAAREELKQKITGVKQNEKEKSKKKMGHNPKQAAV